MIISIFLFLFMLSNKIFNSILFQYHPDKTIDSDDETKILFGEILKMINNSYEIAIETHGTEQDLEDFTQSQSSEPSDKFSQEYGAGHDNEHFDSYTYHKTQEQYSETPDERYKREKETEKKAFFESFNTEKWRQAGKEHRRQKEEEEIIDLQKEDFSYKMWHPIYKFLNKKKDPSMKGKKRKRETDNQKGPEECKRIFDLHEKEKEQQSQQYVNQLEELREEHRKNSRRQGNQRIEHRTSHL